MIRTFLQHLAEKIYPFPDRSQDRMLVTRLHIRIHPPLYRIIQCCRLIGSPDVSAGDDALETNIVSVHDLIVPGRDERPLPKAIHIIVIERHGRQQDACRCIIIIIPDHGRMRIRLTVAAIIEQGRLNVGDEKNPVFSVTPESILQSLSLLPGHVLPVHRPLLSLRIHRNPALLEKFARSLFVNIIVERRNPQFPFTGSSGGRPPVYGIIHDESPIRHRSVLSGTDFLHYRNPVFRHDKLFRTGKHGHAARQYQSCSLCHIIISVSHISDNL